MIFWSLLISFSKIKTDYELSMINDKPFTNGRINTNLLFQKLEFDDDVAGHCLFAGVAPLDERSPAFESSGTFLFVFGDILFDPGDFFD